MWLNYNYIYINFKTFTGLYFNKIYQIFQNIILFYNYPLLNHSLLFFNQFLAKWITPLYQKIYHFFMCHPKNHLMVSHLPKHYPQNTYFVFLCTIEVGLRIRINLIKQIKFLFELGMHIKLIKLIRFWLGFDLRMWVMLSIWYIRIWVELI